MLLTGLAAFSRGKTLDNTYRYAGGTVTILIGGEETGGSFALLDSTQRPGAEPPLHVHEREDEAFYILEGEVAVLVGGAVHRLTPGHAIFLPRDVPHTFRIKSPTARVLTLLTPAGFEEWFRKLGTPAPNFELPERVAAPTEDELARMFGLATRLGSRVIPEPVEL